MNYDLTKNEYNSILFLMNTIWDFSVIHFNPTEYILDDLSWIISNRD